MTTEGSGDAMQKNGSRSVQATIQERGRSVMIDTLLELCNIQDGGEAGSSVHNQRVPNSVNSKTTKAKTTTSVPEVAPALCFDVRQFCKAEIKMNDFPSNPSEAEAASVAVVNYIHEKSRTSVQQDRHHRRYVYHAALRSANDVLRYRASRNLNASTSRFIDLETGVRMRYLSYDTTSSTSHSHAQVASMGSKKTVLFIHDLGDNAESFSEVIAHLNSYYNQSNQSATDTESMYARAPFCSICVDLRGHGSSSHSLDHTYSPDVLVNDVIKFIVATDIYMKKCVIVGAGMGAVVAGLAAKK